MLKQVTVTNRRSMSLVIELDENDSGFQIQSIDDLHPVKATLSSTNYVGLDGSQFQSARRGPRNIVMKIDLQPDFVTNTYTTLRKKLYTYFMPKSWITLRFLLSTGLYLDIRGVVEDHSSEMFTDDPTVQIGIMCFQPDFVDPRMVILDGFTVDNSVVTEIDYPGTVETGIFLTLNVNRSLPEFTIYNTGEDSILTQLDFNGALLDGDQLFINTNKGQKSITLLRDGVSTSFLYGKTAQSTWIELSEGNNNFRVYAPGDPVPYELSYSRRYGGI